MIDRQYEDLLDQILMRGVTKGDRTGVGTRSLFGTRLRYDLSESFPLITTKKVAFRTMATELLWFLRGDTNTGWLRERGVHIWDEWADENGELGPLYGAQWRSWPSPDGSRIDQISNVLMSLKTNPNSRRHIVSAWNVAELNLMALEPCHILFQFDVTDGRLSCQVYQRSCDLFLGVPFNIASYALLTRMMAQQTGHEPGNLIWIGGDTHIYNSHVDQVREQLSRTPNEFPQLDLIAAPSLFDYTVRHFELRDYDHHPAISAPVAV